MIGSMRKSGGGRKEMLFDRSVYISSEGCKQNELKTLISRNKKSKI
jgi:hypothetical protein